MSARDSAGQFTNILIQAAGQAIPKTCFSKKLSKVPRFSGSFNTYKNDIYTFKK